ncbi:uncharacterized protein LOC123558896 [Mercenaria mercenaria]|uniref:uncharacterized protein LOC123558896 n=1 Tax=Mercenaria mercenaria TaxID=6596 RepID=UPI00234ECA3E|nr:uncharacterized protein LOC123558896 [Mercenaria mercenaria]
MVWLQNAVVFLVALSQMPVPQVHCDNKTWKNEIEYFEKVDLDCAKFNQNSAVIHSVKAWILPSGEIWKQGTDFNSGHIVIRNDGFVLSIDRLDDDDFGVYYCIVDTGPNGTHIVKIGVNVDGPYFGPELMEEVRHDAMVGGIAAGCALVLFIILWLVCTYCTKTPLPPNTGNIRSVPAIQNTGKPTEDITMTKIGDSVYYNADEIATENAQTPKEPPQEEGKSETLSSTNSGYYHSIDSIDRNKKLQNVNPADVYM